MASEPIELTAEQIRLIEKANPAFRERHLESSRPEHARRRLDLVLRELRRATPRRRPALKSGSRTRPATLCPSHVTASAIWRMTIARELRTKADGVQHLSEKNHVNE